MKSKLPTLLILLSVLCIADMFSSSHHAQAQDRGVRVVKIKADDGKEITLYSDSHALVIGVSHYTKGWRELPGVERDVADVSSTLSELGFDVEVLPNPTRAAFDLAVRSFIGKWGQSKDGRLLIYFAGHGGTVTTSYGAELGYIIPADAPLFDKGLGEFKQMAISMSEIETYARQIDTKHVLFVFDSCFSGSLFNEMTRGMPEAIKSKTALPVRAFITAGDSKQQVPDESVFRQYFIKGLRGEADTNRDGYITGTELGEYLFNKVTNDSRATQTPRYGTIRDPRLSQGDFVFVSPVSVRQDLPEKLLASVPQLDQAQKEQVFWDLIKSSNNKVLFEAYLELYPKGTFSAQAKLRLNPEGNQQSHTATRPVAGTVSGALTGRVFDSETSLPIADALVRVVHQEIGLERKAESQEDGSFFLSYLPPGRYAITITKDGYQNILIKDFMIHISYTEVIQPPAGALVKLADKK